MAKLPSDHVNPDGWLPSKDHFEKTNKIFNSLFAKKITIKEGAVSKTNVIGVIWVNFAQVAIRKILEKYGHDEFLLTCGHTMEPRQGFIVEPDTEVNCYRCGMVFSYRSFEHEWSHIIFKSSPALYDRFIQLYASQFAEPIAGLLALIVNAFDDIRVNSLWRLVYPGSADDIEKKWKELCEENPEANTNFIGWLFAVALGAENLGSGPFHDLIPLARKAMSAVRGRGAANMLVVVKWFLEQCIDRLIHPPSEDEKKQEGKENEQQSGENGSDGEEGEHSGPPAEDQQEAIERIMKNAYDFRRGQEHHTIDKSDYVSKIAFALPKNEEAALTKLLNLKLENKQEIPDLQPSGEKRPIDPDMEAAVEALQQAAIGDTSSNQHLLANASSKVLLADVKPEHILPDSKIELTEESLTNIERMRAVFAKFIGKKISRLIDDGEEIDVQALIQYRLDGQSDEVFEDEGLTRGFAYMTLCDMSQSMEGSPFHYVCAGSEILKKALDYPFVQGYLWGFRGAIGVGHGVYVTTPEKIAALTKGGEVWIYRYDEACDGYLSSGVEATGYNEEQREIIPVSCDGMTPTHTGIHLAVKHLSTYVSSGMEKRIFLLTDGNPTQFKHDGKDLSRDALMRFVRKEIDTARSKNIKVYTIILGDAITEKDAFEMFGPQAYWRRVPAEQVGSALMELVTKEFVRFLRQ